MLSFTSAAGSELAVIAEGITDGHQKMPELMCPMIARCSERLTDQEVMEEIRLRLTGIMPGGFGWDRIDKSYHELILNKSQRATGDQHRALIARQRHDKSRWPPAA
ncbi:hypothetical protein Q7C36_023507 [Tachysurus vachellii]|uniref:Uncharacterized protein n=1 Tax=Tachysurus vachellii TaxID=175792 RepID=A0AA88IMH8_TACVA|nr:hypothetical protein Q7C36_023507 [Tachysurus vachellii]